MSWIAVDKDGSECIYSALPYRRQIDEWGLKNYDNDSYVYVSKGVSLLLTGKQLTWDDEPVELPGEIIPPKLTVADVREFLDMLTREEITFSRMVELLNERLWKKD